MSDVTGRQKDLLAAALGLTKPAPDPQKLTAELQARDAALRQQTIENSVLRTASRYGANGAALADSKAFMDKVAALDPASAGFDDDLGMAIRSAVEAAPRFRAGEATAPHEARTTTQPTRSVGAQNGGGTAPRQWTIEDVKRSTPAQCAEALEAGLLLDLGAAPTKRRR
jgi:hypothetical protein